MGNTALGHTFDATQVEPQGAPEPVPTDWYNVMITDGEVKPTKANDGRSFYAELWMKIMDGKLQGRMIVDRLNLWNDNPVAVEIAQKTLSAICHATGVFQVSDIQQLFGKPLMARAVLKADSDYPDVKGYGKIGEHESKNSGAAQAGPQPSAANPNGAQPNFTPPWGQNQNPQPTPAQPSNPAPTQPAPAPAQPSSPPAPATPPAQPTPAPQAPPAPATPPAPTPPAPPQPAGQPAQGGGGGVTPPWAQ